MVCDLERRVRLAKSNVETMTTIMSGWCQTPLFRRREKKEQSLLNLEVRKGGRRRRRRGRGEEEGEVHVHTCSTFLFRRIVLHKFRIATIKSTKMERRSMPSSRR